MSATRVLLLVGVLSILAATGGSYETDPLDPALTWHQPHDLISFDVAHGDYVDFMWRMYSEIIQYCTNRVDGTSVLHRQSYNQKPFRWLIVELTGVGDDDKIMPAIRPDNMYITGFTDKKGRWYVFYNKSGLGLIPGTPVRFSDDYGNLVRGYNAIGNMFLSRDTTLQALKEIANFVPSPTEDAGCLARAVAVMVVIFCEGARFTPILLSVRDGWEHGVAMGDVRSLVVQWKTMSCAVLLSVQHNGQWDGIREAQALRPKYLSRADVMFNSAAALADMVQ